jgi:hypothetical protein
MIAYSRFWIKYPEPDYAWGYRERTAVGFLAAAAWSIAGGIALEEYRDEKEHSGSGRVDLYTAFSQTGKGSKCDRCLWEAKHRYLRFKKKDDKEHPLEIVEAALGSAGKSAKQLKPGKGEKVTRVAFLTLRTSKRLKEKSIGELKSLFQTLKRRKDVFLIAYLADKSLAEKIKDFGILMIAEQRSGPMRGAKK